MVLRASPFVRNTPKGLGLRLADSHMVTSSQANGFTPMKRVKKINLGLRREGFLQARRGVLRPVRRVHHQSSSPPVESDIYVRVYIAFDSKNQHALHPLNYTSVQK